MSSAAGRSASWSAAVSSRSSPIRAASAAPSARSASIRSSVAAARSSASRAAGANANSSPATSVSALPRQLPSAARSRLAASPASPPGQGLAPGAGLRLEGERVHRCRRHGEPVAGRGGLEHAVGHARPAGARPAAGRRGTAARCAASAGRSRGQSRSISAWAGTTRPASRASRISSARTRCPPTRTGRPAASVTSSGPSTLIRTASAAVFTSPFPFPARNPASRSGRLHASAKPTIEIYRVSPVRRDRSRDPVTIRDAGPVAASPGPPRTAPACDRGGLVPIGSAGISR